MKGFFYNTIFYFHFYYKNKNINIFLLFIYEMERILNSIKNAPARSAGILVLVSAAMYMLSSKVLYYKFIYLSIYIILLYYLLIFFNLIIKFI